MTTLTRDQFKTSFARGVDASSTSRQKVDDALGDDGVRALAAADLDRNGVVVGDRELDALWRGVDDFDKDGWRSSVTSQKSLALVASLTPASSTAPSTSTSRPSANDVAALSLDATDDDGLSANDLDAARANVAATYGDAVADDVMTRALGLRLSSLDETGADWVQRHHGSMKGQIDRYQAALSTHLKDAKLIDQNANGRVDDGDVVWRKDAAGKVDVQRLDPALRDRVIIGGAMVGAAEEMDRAAHHFALIKDQTFNATYWTPQGNGTFALRPGVRPSVAVDDLFAHPDAYRFECATALVITQYKAMRDLLGARDFDRVAQKLRIGPWQSESTLDEHTRIWGHDDVEATAEKKATLRAGDYGYFKNWDVSPEGAAEGWQGENVVYLGDGRFYGHPFGIADEQTIVDHLNRQRTPGSSKSASFLDLRSELSSSLLREDRVDG